MEKRFYKKPVVSEIHIFQEYMIATSLGVHDEVDDAMQLSNKDVWGSGLWD